METLKKYLGTLERVAAPFLRTAELSAKVFEIKFNLIKFTSIILRVITVEMIVD